MPIARSIPTITSASDMQAFLKNYQQSLSAGIKSAPTPIAPYNFSATNQRGGVLLKWSSLTYPTGSPTNTNSNQSKISKADGYEVQKSTTGNFAPGSYTSTPLRDSSQSSYFDSVGGAPQTAYYRIRATNGTDSNPYNVHGLFTGVLKHTSIDASDTGTSPTTVRDTFTNSQTQARAKNFPSGVNSPFQ